jgi:uncharacterized membrane protein
MISHGSGTFPYSFPLILHVLFSDSSQLCLHRFIFHLAVPVVALYFVGSVIILLCFIRPLCLHRLSSVSATLF